MTDPASMAAYDLTGYDGVLAFGNVLRDLYLPTAGPSRPGRGTRRPTPASSARSPGRAARATWSGSATGATTSGRPSCTSSSSAPSRDLKLNAKVHGVRYPDAARAALAEAGIAYAGWLPNFDAPTAFARYAVTVHVPRRPYVQALPGIPTIRVFEALACGIPLVCSPWDDAEGLFTPGQDYWVARDGADMRRKLRHPARTTRRRPGHWPPTGTTRSCPATPARTGWTSC